MDERKVREWLCDECDWIGSPEEGQEDDLDECPNCGSPNVAILDVE